MDLQNNLLALVCCSWCRKGARGEIIPREKRSESFLWTMQWSCSCADSCLAAGLQVLHLSLAVYVRLRLRLGDEQHPKVPANKRRMIKTKQKMQITTSPPRAQSLVIIRFFRSSRTEDASCTCDMLSFTLLYTCNFLYLLIKVVVFTLGAQSPVQW